MSLTKSELSATYIPISGIDAPSREPGEESPQLFENLADHNPPRELETEADFLI
jgi:hypothetical protein